ncbi:glutamine synthetase family protein [Halopseudomonas salina]|uniref:Glutamine synthetase n=1 Tax=Halopseudomonas salina TaxID=1323744 RepID=A0ABQ1PYQ6_9GAMM|nr:glutamine synthetase family protein [Halopseudomonas salina]GGD07241.1 glutamine synthetase [Halopseudomonas salina]
MSSPLAALSLEMRLAGVAEIECVTPDLNGIPRGKVMTVEGFLAGRRLQMARGVLLQALMGGYPEPRFFGDDDGDLQLRALADQVHVLPWAETPRALAVCEAVELDGTLSGLSCRTLLKQVVGRYAERNWQPIVATELEFFLFERHSDANLPFQPPVGIDGRRDPGNAAFSVSSNNGLRPFFDEIKVGMAALGIPRDTFMHEMGVSQFEINFVHGDPLLIADQTFLFKHMLHEVALKHGLIAVCMAKPLARVPGCSMHIHQSVIEKTHGRNIFTDPRNNEPTFSFPHYIGGLQLCLADLTLLMAPNINSYQRFCHIFASPNNLCWAQDNRSAGLRIPASTPDARRVENRLPGADANPYLAIAASLAAGLHGIDNEIEPSPSVSGQFVAPDHLKLPGSLHEAINRLSRSTLARELFDDEFIDGYLATKTLELEHFLDEITPWERRFLGSQV